MRIGVSITMRVSFRLVAQEFSNTFHYELPTAVAAPSEAIIDELVTTLKKMHSTDVTFVRGAVWSAGGSPASNEMLFQKNLSGTGSVANDTSMDRERAFLIQWKAGKNSLGRPVTLKKWIHSCGAPAGVSVSAGQLQNTAPLSDASRAAMAALAEEMKEVGGLETWQLCARSGRKVEAGAQATCHRWLEHHQLGDQWR